MVRSFLLWEERMPEDKKIPARIALILDGSDVAANLLGIVNFCTDFPLDGDGVRQIHSLSVYFVWPREHTMRVDSSAKDLRVTVDESLQKAEIPDGFQLKFNFKADGRSSLCDMISHLLGELTISSPTFVEDLDQAMDKAALKYDYVISMLGERSYVNALNPLSIEYAEFEFLGFGNRTFLDVAFFAELVGTFSKRERRMGGLKTPAE